MTTERNELATDRVLFGRGAPSTDASQPQRELLLCRCAGLLLAVPLSAIYEVGRLPAAVTLVPGAPPALAGIVKWRAGVFPALDLSLHLGAAPPATPARTRTLVVVSLDESWVGCVVDEVIGTCRVPAAAVSVELPTPGATGPLRVLGTLELAPELLDEGSYVPAAVRERCRVPIADLVATSRDVLASMPTRFPGSSVE